ncbi:hypothetical protein QE419_001520 [Brevundimonas vesicularis]|uniref:DUF2946 family protein n=1 Tax=Brevundimonas vesicularis TaxID=41276 RepID=UPI00278A45BC|nr:DUF2946 family protein [Brevundimonas vesicularis]MDQ1192754.1 hypothetical protein [Brevundimonas vesicularis]
MRARNDRQEDGLGFAIALCALLFALTFRALLPTGYMLETHGDGIELVLCGSGGLQTIVVDANGRPGDTPAHTDKGKTDAVCAFASVAAVAPADDLAVVASRPPWSARPAAMPASIPRDWRNPRGPPPPLRGPPFSMI